MDVLICHCGLPMSSDGGVMSTLLGYASPPGHNHDDNCRCRMYMCEHGHVRIVFKRNRCPACDWVGKKHCNCHEGEKLEEWPPNPKKVISQLAHA